MDKKVDKAVVSFCIATFQRYNLLAELVREILSVDSDKIEVAICDDHSQDDSIERIRQIQDPRLKIFVNDNNIGSLPNICEALDKGEGEYLFYVNDRDNVDPFKIKALVEILECLKKDDVAFAKCIPAQYGKQRYCIFQEGEEALVEFACCIDHPTGFIFKKEVWHRIRKRRLLFEDQKYGDFAITQMCAIMAQKYKGAVIYGDICSLKRRRLDFTIEKSGYYRKRKDKRLWYSPEVIYREIKIGQKFLKQIGVSDQVRSRILIDRYTRYLPLCVTRYEELIADPLNTDHYDFYPKQDFVHIFTKSVLNGLKLWSYTKKLCTDNRTGRAIAQVTRCEYRKFFQNTRMVLMPFEGKLSGERKKEEAEIEKREAALDTYERWLDKLIFGKRMAHFFERNGYRKVAIYGMGRIGKHLLADLKNSSIDVIYVIDQNISRNTNYFEGIPCYSLDSKLPYVDMLIITVPSEAEKIKEDLNKRVPYQIESINDILFVL